MKPPQTIVITGCTRGLGRAMAGYFIEHGALVAGCGRSPSELEKMRMQYGAKHDFTEVDVASDQAVSAWAKHVMVRFGPPDLLINNAAVIARNAPLWEAPASEINAVIDINIRGTIHVLQHFLPAMKERGSGVVANFSSGWGRSTSPEVAAYCASKWAIEGLTQALAQELEGTGVTVVALNPGIIDTDMLRVCFGASAGHYPSPEQWVKKAGPFLLRINAANHGRSLDVPGTPVD
jgi:NAD(P)-dependent dehydrogenase (short-subunit alcohol dehydrogenase family)